MPDSRRFLVAWGGSQRDFTMEDEIILLLLVLLLIAAAVLILPIVAVVKAVGASRKAREAEARTGELKARTEALESRVQLLMKLTAATPVAAAAGTPVPPGKEEPAPPADARPAPARPAAADIQPPTPKPVTPPPPLPPPAAKPAPALAPAAAAPAAAAHRRRASAPPAAPARIARPARSVSVEQFMGVKLFAWLGGIAMFFGVIFFVKYAFERNLIPPAVRVALGFVTGAGLLVGGLVDAPQEGLPGARPVALRHRRADPLRREFRRPCGLSLRGLQPAGHLRPDDPGHRGGVPDRGAAGCAGGRGARDDRRLPQPGAAAERCTTTCSPCSATSRCSTSACWRWRGSTSGVSWRSPPPPAPCSCKLGWFVRFFDAGPLLRGNRHAGSDGAPAVLQRPVPARGMVVETNAARRPHSVMPRRSA